MKPNRASMVANQSQNQTCPNGTAPKKERMEWERERRNTNLSEFIN